MRGILPAAGLVFAEIVQRPAGVTMGEVGVRLRHLFPETCTLSVHDLEYAFERSGVGSWAMGGC